MTPRAIVAHLHFLEQDLAAERADLFNIVRAAMHADEKQADEFLRELKGLGPEQGDLPDEFFS